MDVTKNSLNKRTIYYQIILAMILTYLFFADDTKSLSLNDPLLKSRTIALLSYLCYVLCIVLYDLMTIYKVIYLIFKKQATYFISRKVENIMIFVFIILFIANIGLSSLL